METLKILKSVSNIVRKTCNKVYMALGLAFVPVLTFADGQGQDLGAAFTHMSSEANSGKILIFNIILALGAGAILVGFITIFRKHVEHKWGKVATLIIVGALAMAPRLLVTTGTQSVLGSSTNASGNTTQQFSAGGQ